MRPEDLVLGVVAEHPLYCAAITGRFGLEPRRVLDDLYNRVPRELLQEAGVRFNAVHGDSQQLEDAFPYAVAIGTVRRWLPRGELTWSFPVGPQKYFAGLIERGYVTPEEGELVKRIVTRIRDGSPDVVQQ